MQLTNISDILKDICRKSKGGCVWSARPGKWYSYVKLTKNKFGKSDKIEFRTRIINFKNKEPNVVFLKLKEPVILDGVDWYIGKYKKSKKHKKNKANKTNKKKK